MHIRSNITAAWKRYNANSKDIDTGDCVKRSISLAYGIDYDQVAKDLNKIKRDIGVDAFNIHPVYDRYIMSLGVDEFGKPKKFGLADKLTVDEFCNAFTEGTFIILCGKAPGRTSHMVCIIDGDYWDSWDSGMWYVSYIYCVSGATTVIETLNIESIADEIETMAQACIDKSAKKMPYAEFEFQDMDIHNTYTAEQDIVCIVHLDQLGLTANGRNTSRARYTYTIKLNPKLTIEQNLDSLKKKLWVKIREWAYSVRKYVEDAAKLQKAGPHKHFIGDRTVLAKMPEWAIPRITWIHDNGSDPYGYKYEMTVEAFPEDPRYSPTDKELTIYGDNITELRKYLEAYKANFARQDWGDF